MLATIYADEEYARAMTAVYAIWVREYAPDVVIDSFELLSCLAARVLKVPLATVLQGNFHPASRGFLWWQREGPAGLPSAVSVINQVASEYGLPPKARCVDGRAGW